VRVSLPAARGVILSGDVILGINDTEIADLRSDPDAIPMLGGARDRLRGASEGEEVGRDAVSDALDGPKLSLMGGKNALCQT
jgi:S1-C subfamily serine protease